MTAWSVLFLCLAPPRPTGPDCLSLTTTDRAPLPPSGRGIQTATARGTTVIPHLVVPRPPAPGLPPATPRGRVDTFRQQRSRTSPRAVVPVRTAPAGSRSACAAVPCALHSICVPPLVCPVSALGWFAVPFPSGRNACAYYSFVVVQVHSPMSECFASSRQMEVCNACARASALLRSIYVLQSRPAVVSECCKTHGFAHRSEAAPPGRDTLM